MEKKESSLVDSIKEQFFKWLKSDLVKSYLFKFIKTNAVKYLIGLGLKMTGPMGWLVNFLINKGSKLLWKVLRKIGIYGSEEVETKKEVKEHGERINAPGATEEVIKKSGKDFITK